MGEGIKKISFLDSLQYFGMNSLKELEDRIATKL